MVKLFSAGKKILFYLLILSTIIGCGTGGIDTATTPSSSTSPSPTTTPVPASIDLLVSSTHLNSDGISTVKLTALVRDAANRAMMGQKVDFTADSGLLIVTGDTTDVNGMATATLGTGGNPLNRPIEVKAATAAKEAKNTINVSGTTLDISGLNSLSLGDATPLTIFLKDSAGGGISGKTIAVASAKHNTLSSSSYVTNANGQITVNITATQSGMDTVSASFTGVNKDFTLSVDPNIFKIIAPASAGKEVNIGVNEPITVEYKINGVAVNGATINFATTRGILSNSTALTGTDGRATISTSSINSGPALISAFVAGGPSAQLAMEFVATTASKIALQANPASIGTNSSGLAAEKSLLTAIVRDANNNLVKNKTIKFTIERDSSGGSLSPGSATTDGSGTANTYFIGGATPGAKDGVTIRATLVDAPTVTATANLTVSQKAMFITVATGPTVEKVEPNKYRQNYVALVTDAAGNPIKSAPVSATLTPNYFRKGYYVWGGELWVLVPTLDASSTTLPAVPACGNEDVLTHNSLYDYNGVLDIGEDVNLNNRLDPGNVASVAATPTDENGFSTVSIAYARDYAAWVNVRLEVSASTAGDTARAYANFDLSGVGSDYAARATAPPGYISPFGTSTTCLDTRPDPPGGLTVVAASASKINLSWQPAARATGYKIFRNGVFLKSTVVDTSADAGLGAGTQYCYSLAAYDDTGNDSAQSAQVCVTTPSLLAPTFFSLAPVSPSQISLSWTASAGAVSYNIYRGGVYLKSVATTTAQATGLNSDTQYCFTIAAVDGNGIESAPTSQLCAQTPKLAPPTNLTVTPVNAARIDIAWSVVSGAAGYNIYRAGGSTPFTSVRAPADLITPVTFSDTGLFPSTPYCYTISAYDEAKNESLQTALLCATTYGVPPAEPTGLMVSVTEPGGAGVPALVNLSWTASSGASQYTIYRNGTLLQATSFTYYTDNTGAASTQYTYQVKAVDGTGSESLGQSSRATINTGLTVPANPTVTVNSATQITVSWTNAGGSLVAGYKVYRNGVLLAAVPPTTLSVVDGGLSSSTQYCYYVTATDDKANESARSITLCAATEAPPLPNSIDLLVGNPQINSDGVAPITLTALVKDNNNRAMANQVVMFTADSYDPVTGTVTGITADAGILIVVNAVTNASGQAMATLGTGGNQKNRLIAVSAKVGSLPPVFKTVEVAGTTITVSGQTNSVLVNGKTMLTVYLKDSSGKGIPYQGLTLTTENYGNTLSPTAVTTDASGQATTVFTANDAQGRTDRVTASSTSNMCAPGGFDIAVQANANAKVLTFTAPVSGNEVLIKTNKPVTVHYADSSGPIGGAAVKFSSTRGIIASTAVTNGPGPGFGDANLTISSATPGPAKLTAFIADGPTAELSIEFIAITAARIDVQANPATISKNTSGSTVQQSDIVAVVRDADNNLIKNKAVNFNIVKGSGTLSSGTAITDSFGAARVKFIAGETSSAQDGVEISATVADDATITNNTSLTVVGKPLFITVGTGNIIRIDENNPNFYHIDFGVLVTDPAGNPINQADVTAKLYSVTYLKGYWQWDWIVPPSVPPVGRWTHNLTVDAAGTNHPSPPAPNTPYSWPGPAYSCANEDLTFYNDPAHSPSYLLNGILDPGEDFQIPPNNKLDPGGIAGITPTAKTDANGLGTLTVTYARDYGTWVYVRIDVAVRDAAGTEGTATTTLRLPGLGFDATADPGNPAGQESPFGRSTTCTNEN